ncbi:hypothetical protein [Paenibacillus aestuarii]|uniref:Uncharacterized protein n=1 Tax=Paenibacillus aestuarii TaxID=516965 RepID=A0ABW0KI17_9BACL|nr:hypothetical protein [Paenibacillus aestuarii]
MKYKEIKNAASVNTIKGKKKNQTNKTISKKAQSKKSTRTKKSTQKRI